MVFLFDDRIISTRRNKVKSDRFHYKNELLLSTGKLKFKKNAERLDVNSFLNSTPHHDLSEEDDLKRDLNNQNRDLLDDEFEREIVDMEDHSNTSHLPSRPGLDDGEKKEEKKYFCFLVANGRKAKFFYARSQKEMDRWCNFFQKIVDKQNMSAN